MNGLLILLALWVFLMLLVYISGVGPDDKDKDSLSIGDSWKVEQLEPYEFVHITIVGLEGDKVIYRREYGENGIVKESSIQARNKSDFYFYIGVIMAKPIYDK